MRKGLMFALGLMALGIFSGCANGYVRNACPCSTCPMENQVSGKLASSYRPSDVVPVGSGYTYTGSYEDAPVYLVNGVGPDFYASYHGGAEVPYPEVALRNNRKVYGGQYGHGVRSGVGVPLRPAMLGSRRAANNVNPYEGIDPTAGNPYAGNTPTRGPRDFLMTNPPNIGP